MDDFEAQFDAAVVRGKIEFATKPRAVAVHYDRERDRLIIDLANGSVFMFPPRLAQGLVDASPEQIAEVEIVGAGFGLHWESIDADHLVESLLAGRFGSARYMVERFGADWQADQAA